MKWEYERLSHSSPPALFPRRRASLRGMEMPKANPVTLGQSGLEAAGVGGVISAEPRQEQSKGTVWKAAPRGGEYSRELPVLTAAHAAAEPVAWVAVRKQGTSEGKLPGRGAGGPKQEGGERFGRQCPPDREQAP